MTTTENVKRCDWDDWGVDGEAIRYHNPDDFGWDDEDHKTFLRTKAKGLDMIIRPSGDPDTASVFVGHNLIHIPKADALKIALVLLKAAGLGTAELLAALDAEPKSVADGLRVKLAEVESEVAKLRVVDSDGQDLFDRAVSRADRLEAERDAHAATIGRVREVVAALGAEAEKARLAAIGQHDTAWSRLSGRQMALHDAAGTLDAALAPEPAFALPTKAGSGIEAERIDGPFKGETQELRLFSDGRWFNSTGHPAWPDDVMSEYTGHRLLDNNGAGPVTAEDLEGIDSADVESAE